MTADARAPIDDDALDALFRVARTHNSFRDEPVSEVTLRALFELVKMGPTSANGLPGRFVFLVSKEAKAKLGPALSSNNRDKTMKAPATVIVAHDVAWHENLPRFFPHTNAKSWFEGNDALIAETAFRNGTLMGGYLIMAARALGLDCGPMSGFDQAKVDEAFFPDGRWRTNFLVNLGYGDGQNMFDRLPRPDFDEFCRIV
ncbi:malonic semialdehyde reductase [Hansschlegelia zhihuaiae]|uniref:Putative NADH dehydrogenase/NAD(P)H nitroreductase EK403_19535 n=1 Tax=Hansschlegelia zhihuaiae TaxID=405005 RepID=A0A4Q0M6X6_9HYPH|nr:malonic semialdehyde reductase [Hansschlegelia zhihuaiae]RXF68754.1 malonic semialdehyde reductase [Hansschlegelia zhihuaiae]